jgi:DNA-binding NtrC family response regulator
MFSHNLVHAVDLALPARKARVPAKVELKRFGALYGNSPPMEQLYQMIAKVAATDATVLIHGESGTGKELVARTIHDLSSRRDKPFIAVNCGAISSTLIEAELFGHERGSFTGAHRTHKGYFERATGGTLFLDEISEMAPELQVELLRVLENGTLHRVGGDQEIKVQVRVLAATNRKPEAAVAQGLLREDLMYRLAVFPIIIPALRERPGDAQLLARHFLELLNDEHGADKKFSARALTLTEEHPWLGNVRELKNVVERAFILAAEDTVELDGLLQQFPSVSRGAGGRLQFAVGTPLAEAERELVMATLQHYGGNKKKAAEVLGVSLKTLYNRLSEYRSEGLMPAPAAAA